MDCNASHGLVHRAIDGELSNNIDAKLSRHVAGCPACRNLYDRQRSLKDAVRSQAARYIAPAALAERIGAALDKGTARARGGPPNW